MSKLNIDQVDYLRNVLGIDRVIVPAFVTEHSEMPAIDNGHFESEFQEGVPGNSEWRSSGDQNAAKLIVLIASENSGFPLEGEAGDLTHKMIQAMKYPSSHVFILEWNHACVGNAPEGLREVLSNDPKPLLIFGAKTAASLAGEIPAFGEWTDWEGSRLLITEHPNDLLQAPEKKRTAWTHLQTFMKGLS